MITFVIFYNVLKVLLVLCWCFHMNIFLFQPLQILKDQFYIYRPNYNRWTFKTIYTIITTVWP